MLASLDLDFPSLSNRPAMQSVLPQNRNYGMLYESNCIVFFYKLIFFVRTCRSVQGCVWRCYCITVGMVNRPQPDPQEFQIHNEDFPALPGTQSKLSNLRFVFKFSCRLNSPQRFAVFKKKLQQYNDIDFIRSTLKVGKVLVCSLYWYLTCMHDCCVTVKKDIHDIYPLHCVHVCVYYQLLRAITISAKCWWVQLVLQNKTVLLPVLF